MYKLLNVLAICLIFSGTATASESIYSGPPLSIDYAGPILVDNSQYRYTSDDRLGFSTSDWLTAQYPNLLPLRSVIDSWSARLSIHPKVLSAVLNDYFDGAQTLADSLEIEAVVQVASALATVYAQQSPDPLAASQAVMATATALSFTLELPPELAQQRSILGLKAAPVLHGYFQPPWEIGDTWAGGGAHSENHSALDFWGEYRNWGADVSQWWVTAMQAGMVRVYSSCDIDVIHPNGWVTGYYHLENIQVSDGQFVERNDRLANYANDIAQALCSGGSSSGPHVHMSLSYNGERVSVDESQVDFTAFSHHEGVGDYDTNCSRSWYTHFSQGRVCPNYDDLLNDAPLPDAQPQASFTVTPMVGEAPLTVTVDAGASNGSGISYLWNFGDGTTGTQVSTTHTFTEVGEYTISLTVTDDNGITDTTTNSVRATSPIILQDNFESGVLSDVTDVWQVVNLNHDYTSMVVIASVNLPSQDSLPGVTRIRNASGSSFELKIQNPSDQAISGYDVHYLVLEEGVYTMAQHGIKMEAGTFSTATTSENNNWVLEARSYANDYSNPVILGQVMSANDPAWSVFWASSDNRRTNPPQASSFSAGKHVGEDSLVPRVPETLAYVVFEAGNSSFAGVDLIAGLSSDSIRGVKNSAQGYSHSLNGFPAGHIGLLSAAAMDGSDGGWPVLFGQDPVSNSQLILAIDEDQIRDNERSHTSEQVAYVVLAPVQQQSILFASNFDTGTDGFSYVDDSFRNTNQAAYAEGAYASELGFSGGAARIIVGGINNTDVNGMSGAWTRSFNLASNAEVSVSFRYKLTQASNYESDELSQALLAVDGDLLGSGGNDYLAQLVGNGNGGSVQSTDWVSVEFTTDLLTAGTHTLMIGVYNNKKTYHDETTEILIDDVVVSIIDPSQTP